MCLLCAWWRIPFADCLKTLFEMTPKDRSILHSRIKKKCFHTYIVLISMCRTSSTYIYPFGAVPLSVCGLVHEMDSAYEKEKKGLFARFII